MTDDTKSLLLQQVKRVCLGYKLEEAQDDPELKWVQAGKLIIPKGRVTDEVLAMKVDTTWGQLITNLNRSLPLAALLEIQGFFVGPKWCKDKNDKDVLVVVIVVCFVPADKEKPEGEQKAGSV